MSHPEYDALYAAVCAAPDDDTPRLVLADWLDEHDDPHRAALIRAQVGWAQARAADPHAAAVCDFLRSGPHASWARHADRFAIGPVVAQALELAAAAQQALPKAAARWQELRGKRRAGTVTDYVRGFPYGFLVPNVKRFAAAVAREKAEALPGYGLTVIGVDGSEVDALIGSGRLNGVRGLTLYGFGDPTSVARLGARPEVRGVRELDLNLNTGDPRAIAAFAVERNWSGLERLAIDLNPNAGVDQIDLPAEFFGADHLQTLTALRLGLRGLTGVALAGVAALGLPRLQDLDASFNAVDAAGAAVLAGGAFPELRRLELGRNEIGNGGAEALAGGRKLSALATLELNGNGINDPEAVSALIAGPALPALSCLSLFDNRVYELAPKRLAAPGRGPTLRLLSLRLCSLSAKSAAPLASCPALAGLVGLDLSGNDFGDEGVIALTRAARWPDLTALDLGANGITAAGVKALAEWPGVSRLAALDLRRNPIGLKGAEILARCQALETCRKLAVPHEAANLPPDGLKLMKKAFGRRLATD